MKNPLFKFFVGFFAGLCAALFPRLLAILAAQGVSIQLLDTVYIVTSLVFSLLIGVIIMLFEWNQPRAPKDSFMTALAIPALISGSLNTASGVQELKKTEELNIRLTETLKEQEAIETLPPTAVSPVRPNVSLLPALHVLSSAYAADRYYAQTDQSPGYDLGIRLTTPLYYLVLAQFATKEQAQAKAAELRQSVPTAAVVRTADGRFLVLSESEPRARSEAVLKAVELKKVGVNAQLLPVPQ